MKIRFLIALGCAVLVGSSANAWNNFGHMEAAALAWSQLTPAAKQEATRLLKLNPQYDGWIQGVPASQRDQVAFVKAATWPDQIKSLGDYHNDGDRNGDVAPHTPKRRRISDMPITFATSIGTSLMNRSRRMAPHCSSRNRLTRRLRSRSSRKRLRIRRHRTTCAHTIFPGCFISSVTCTSRCTRPLALRTPSRMATPEETTSRSVAENVEARGNSMRSGMGCWDRPARHRRMRSTPLRIFGRWIAVRRMRTIGSRRASRSPRVQCTRRRSAAATARTNSRSLISQGPTGSPTRGLHSPAPGLRRSLTMHLNERLCVGARDKLLRTMAKRPSSNVR